MTRAQSLPESTPFPVVAGENLEGRAYRIPDELPGSVRLILLAFEQRQQRDVETWFPTAARLAEAWDDLTWWEFPTLQTPWRLMRWFIDGGMRSGIPDLSARERTITLYLDRAAFLRSLEIPGPERIAVLLLDGEGRVRWRAYGRASEAGISELEDALADLAPAPDPEGAPPTAHDDRQDSR